MPRASREPRTKCIHSLADWKVVADRVDQLTEEVIIGIVGKYTGLQDSYLSVFKALKHSCIEAGRRLEIEYVDSEKLDAAAAKGDAEAHAAAWACVEASDGVVVPGGFGDRGVEGMIACARWCRENGKPYLGVCLGMQVAVVEYARSVLGRAKAHSTEFDAETPWPTVIFMPEAVGEKGEMGGCGARTYVVRSSANVWEALADTCEVVGHSLAR